MSYVNAFLLAGVVCTIFQLLLMFTKLGVPKILILGLTIGAIMAAMGIMSILTGWGGAGMLVLIPDAGEAVFQGTLAALSGNFTVIIGFFSIICAVTVLGILAALSYLMIHNTQPEVGSEEMKNKEASLNQ
ncbi:MAG: SpoVA/SpoVAEb family sporulation membrane protein [Eubacteriales bacterium]